MTLLTDLSDFLADKVIRATIETTLEMVEEDPKCKVDEIYEKVTGMKLDSHPTSSSKKSAATTKGKGKVEDTRCTLEEYESKYEGGEISVCTHIIDSRDGSGYKICCKEVKNGTVSEHDKSLFRCGPHKTAKINTTIDYLKLKRDKQGNADSRAAAVGATRRGKEPEKPKSLSNSSKSSDKTPARGSLSSRFSKEDVEVDEDTKDEKSDDERSASVLQSSRSVHSRRDTTPESSVSSVRGGGNDDENEDTPSTKETTKETTKEKCRSKSKSKSKEEGPSDLFKKKGKKVSLNPKGRGTSQYDFYPLDDLKNVVVIHNKTKKLEGIHRSDETIDIDARLVLDADWHDELKTPTRVERRICDENTFSDSDSD